MSSTSSNVMGFLLPLRELENMVDTALLVTRAALQNPLSFSTPLIRSGRAPSSPGGSQDGRSLRFFRPFFCVEGKVQAKRGFLLKENLDKRLS